MSTIVTGLKNARVFYALARERHVMRMKKEAGEPGPWTQDELLANYHWRNVTCPQDTDHFEMSENLEMGVSWLWMGTPGLVRRMTKMGWHQIELCLDVAMVEANSEYKYWPYDWPRWTLGTAARWIEESWRYVVCRFFGAPPPDRLYPSKKPICRGLT